MQERSYKVNIIEEQKLWEEDFHGFSCRKNNYSPFLCEDPDYSIKQMYSEKYELQQKIKVISKSTNGKESLLKAQLTEINSHLLSLQSRKQAEVQRTKELKEKYQIEIEELKLRLQKLEQQYSILVKSSKNRMKIYSASNQAKLKTYQETAANLERKLEETNKEKQKLNRKQENLQNSIEKGKHISGMAKEELIQAYCIRAELIAENEHAEATLELLREDQLETFNNQELNDYFEGCKNNKFEQQELLAIIRETQTKIEILIRSIDEKEKSAEEVNSNIQALYNTVLNEKDQKEIENLENLIRETCENLALEPWENVMLSLNAYEQYDLDEEILKIQLAKVESEEILMREAWEAESMSLQEVIKWMEDSSEEKNRVRAEYKTKCQGYLNKVAAISQWKNEVISALSNRTRGLSGPVKDRTVYLEFKNISINKVENNKSQKSFENLMTLYIERISALEKTIQTHYKDISKLETQREQLSKQCKAERARLNVLEKFKLAQQINLTRLMCKEKSLILVIRNSDPEFILKVQGLSELISQYTNKIQFITDHIENHLKFTISTCTDSSKSMLKDYQNYKIILQDLIEEENTLTMNLEKVLEKQHSFMLNSLSEAPKTEDLSELVQNIESISAQIEGTNKKLSILETESFSMSVKLEEEENILNMKLYSLNDALKNLSFDQKKLEDFKTQLHKIEESEAAPIPESMDEKSRSKSVNKIIIPPNETPEKLQTDDLLTSSQSRSFQRSYPSERSPVTLNMIKTTQEEFNTPEKDFIDKLMPLLQGTEIYKRFSQRSSLRLEEFDPLGMKNSSPEACGYGIRKFQLSKCCTRIEIKHLLRVGNDASIPIDSIMKIIIPKITTEIIKMQKRIEKGEVNKKDKNPSGIAYEIMKERGYIDMKSAVFMERCKNCKWFPLSIAMLEGGRIEIIIKTYEKFKSWVAGVNSLIQNKKLLLKVRPRIISMIL